MEQLQLLYLLVVFLVPLRRCLGKVRLVNIRSRVHTDSFLGIHPTIIAESFLRASAKAVEYLTEISMPIDLSDQPSLLRAASTSLNSKVK